MESHCTTFKDDFSLLAGMLALELFCAVLCLVTQSCWTLCNPMDCSLPGSSVHGDSPGNNTGVGCPALLQGNLPNLGIEPRSPTMQADSLPSEPPGKPYQYDNIVNSFQENVCCMPGSLMDPEYIQMS